MNSDTNKLLRSKGRAGYNCAKCGLYEHVGHRAMCRKFAVPTSHSTVCVHFIHKYISYGDNNEK